MIVSAASLRAIRLITDEPGLRRFWLGRSIELLADWVYVVALLVLAYRLTGDVEVLGALMLARLLPRLLLAVLDRALAGVATWARLLKAPLAASIVLVSESGDLWWAGPLVFASGALAALSDATHTSLVRATTPRNLLSPASIFNHVVERCCFVVGALLGSAILVAWNVDAAFSLAAVAFLASGLLRPGARSEEVGVDVSRPAIPAERGPELLVMAVGMFLGAVVAMVTELALVERLTVALDRSTAALGVYLAVVGVGILAGPLHVPRLLGRFPAALIVGGCVAGGAVAMGFIGQVSSEPLVVAALFGMGVLSITAHAVAATATRRLVPDDRLAGSLRLLTGCVVAGQVLGAALVAALGGAWSAGDLLLAVGIVTVVLMAPAVLLQLAFGRGPAQVVAAPK